jgi:hypothetical protein
MRADSLHLQLRRNTPPEIADKLAAVVNIAPADPVMKVRFF